MTVLKFPAIRGLVHDKVADVIEESYIHLNQLQAQIARTNSDLLDKISYINTNQKSQAAALEQALSIIPSAQLTSHGVSTGVIPQGSILPTVGGGLLYDNATANTIKWYSTGLTLPLADGSTIIVPDTTVANPSIAVSGLTAGNSYFFYPFYSLDLRTIKWAIVPGGTGSPAAAYSAKNLAAAQVVNGDGNLALSPTTSVTGAATAGGGGGGGGGGSGCIRVDMYVQAKRSVLQLGHCKQGDEIMGPNGWTFIVKKKTSIEPEFLRFNFGLGDFLDVTPSHPLPIYPEGFLSPAKSWTMADMLKARNGLPARVNGISLIEESDEAMLITCEPHKEFYCGGNGPALVLHNTQPIK